MREIEPFFANPPQVVGEGDGAVGVDNPEGRGIQFVLSECSEEAEVGPVIVEDGG